MEATLLVKLNIFVLTEGELGINVTKKGLIDHEKFNIIETKALRQAR